MIDSKYTLTGDLLKNVGFKQEQNWDVILFNLWRDACYLEKWLNRILILKNILIFKKIVTIDLINMSEFPCDTCEK